jgi:hypothetical protein
MNGQQASIEAPQPTKSAAPPSRTKRLEGEFTPRSRRPGVGWETYAGQAGQQVQGQRMHARINSVDPPSMAGTIQGRLNLLHRGADEAVDRGHRLGVQLRRRQAAHQDLERHRHQRPRRRGPQRAGARRRRRRRARPAVGQDGEARRQERDRRRVLAAHHHVGRRDVDRRVHHQRPRRVGAALLQDQHAVLARVQALQNTHVHFIRT